MIEPETRSGLGWPAADSAAPDRDADDSSATSTPSSVGWPDEMAAIAADAAQDDRTPSIPETEDEMSQTTDATPAPGTSVAVDRATADAETPDQSPPATAPTDAGFQEPWPESRAVFDGHPGSDALAQPGPEPSMLSTRHDVPGSAPADDTTVVGAVDYIQGGALVDADTPIAREVAAALMMSSRYQHPLPRPAETRIMVVSNQKGGVGKTTTTVNLAAALAVSGLKILVVDLDPQGNASTALSIDHTASIPSIYDVLVEERTMAEVAQPVDGFDTLWCVPATIDLAGAEIELVSMVARENRLRRGLEAYLDTEGVDFDYVFIDCPPSLGLLTVNALVGGDEVLIPIQCEYYALEGLSQLLKNIDLVRAHLNPDLAVTTILLTMYDGRTRLAAQVADEVRRHFGDSVLKTTIPRSVRISEAPSYGQTVMTYDPSSSGALSYMEAARELAEAALGHQLDKEDKS